MILNVFLNIAFDPHPICTNLWYLWPFARVFWVCRSFRPFQSMSKPYQTMSDNVKATSWTSGWWFGAFFFSIYWEFHHPKCLTQSPKKQWRLLSRRSTFSEADPLSTLHLPGTWDDQNGLRNPKNMDAIGHGKWCRSSTCCQILQKNDGKWDGKWTKWMVYDEEDLYLPLSIGNLSMASWLRMTLRSEMWDVLANVCSPIGAEATYEGPGRVWTLLKCAEYLQVWWSMVHLSTHPQHISIGVVPENRWYLQFS